MPKLSALVPDRTNLYEALSGGAVTANRAMLAQALRSRNKPAFQMKQPTVQGLLDNAALATSPVPIVGDVVGLGANLYQFATDPESRTLGNVGLAALGLVPFLPPLMSAGLGKLSKTGSIPKPQGVPSSQMGAIVYHGSPHKFDQFDASKIGTGEGAQAYGHGLYFAESPNVAKNYVPRDMATENKLMRLYKQAEARQDYDSLSVIEDALIHKTPSELNELYPNQQSLIEQISKIQSRSKGSIYKVDLPDSEIAKMIDYDKPINQQSDIVLDMLEKAGINTKSSAMAGTMIKGQEGHLSNHGIRGVKYWDEASRDVGEGSRNFVVFPGNESLLKILSRE